MQLSERGWLREGEGGRKRKKGGELREGERGRMNETENEGERVAGD